MNQFVICMQLFISVSIPQSCDKAKRNTSTHNAGRLEIHEVIHAVLSNHYRVGMQHDLVQTPILFASLTHRWKCVSDGKYIANPNWRFTYTSKQTEDHIGTYMNDRSLPFATAVEVFFDIAVSRCFEEMMFL